jgi:hypothetical protein
MAGKLNSMRLATGLVKPKQPVPDMDVSGVADLCGIHPRRLHGDGRCDALLVPAGNSSCADPIGSSAAATWIAHMSLQGRTLPAAQRRAITQRGTGHSAH